MDDEQDENLNAEPVATPELISAAIESAQAQGMDINPYSVALEAGIAAQVLFTNTELMNLVIAARGDQVTFSIDSHLLERCQELETEMAKILEVNQEIYDRALEMEERVIQLEGKVSEMEEDTEHLTMQLQNSWHLGYKKGLTDGQGQQPAIEKPLIDIELPKEETATSKEKPAAQPEEARKQTKSRPIIDIELPEEEKAAFAKREAQEKAAAESLLAIQLPEAEKLNSKSLLDIELPEAEKLANNSHIAIEQDKHQPSIKSLIDIELPKEEKPSIKSLLDFELPKEEEVPAQGEFSAAQAKSGAGANEPAGAEGSYNDRVYNAVSDSVTAGNAVESYGSLSWREVETIYQFSSAGGSAGGGPNLVYEPMSQGQTVGARGGDKGQVGPGSGSGGGPGGAGLAGGEGGGFGRGETQPTRSDTQPIIVSRTGGDEPGAPPILKADAPNPGGKLDSAPAARPGPGGATAGGGKPNPRSTFSNLTARQLHEPDPPIEGTLTQFLGDTNSYINLDRVTLEPDNNLTPQSQGTTAGANAITGDQPVISEAELLQSRAAAQAETVTIAGATQALQAEAQAKAAAAAGVDPHTGAPMSTNASANALTNDPASGAAGGQPLGAGQQATDSGQSGRTTLPPGSKAPQGPSNARWGKREADVTFDGLSSMDHDGTADVLDLEKLDIFEGLEDIEELNQIEVIEDVVLPDAPPAGKKTGVRSSEHTPAVSSDELQDLIKSRIKKAEEIHEPRFDIHTSPQSDKGTASGTGAPAAAGTTSGTGNPYDLASSSSTKDDAAPPPIPSVKELDALRQGARSKFVGGKASGSPLSMPGGGAAAGETPLGTPPASSPMLLSTRGVPPEIRKACMILGVRPEDLTAKEVNEKWKAQLSAPGVHPDQGGDTESAIYLNTAKDTLVKWINDQDSKLGKKFGKKDEPQKDKKDDKKHSPNHPPTK